MNDRTATPAREKERPQRHEHLDALVDQMQQLLLVAKAQSDVRSRALTRVGDVEELDGPMASIEDMLRLIESQDIDPAMHRRLLFTYRMVYETMSRLIGIVSTLPPSVLRQWDQSGHLLDSYHVPAEHLQRARTAGGVDRFRDVLDPMTRAMFDAGVQLLAVEGFSMQCGLRNGRGFVDLSGRAGDSMAASQAA